MTIVLDHLHEYSSVYGAREATGSKLGVGAESLWLWTRPAQIYGNQVPEATTEEQQRIKELERENRDLEEANEILKSASIFFARGARAPQAGSTPTSLPQIVQFIDQMRVQNYGVESICHVLTEHGVQMPSYSADLARSPTIR